MKTFWLWVLLTVAVVGGCSVTIASVFIFSQYVENLRPARAALRRVIVHPREANGNVTLELRLSSSPTSACVRFGSHQLTRPPTLPDDGERHFLLLGGSLSGHGFSAMSQNEFSVSFDLTSSIVPGAYIYTYRTFYQCGIFNLVPFTDEVVATVVIPP